MRSRRLHLPGARKPRRAKLATLLFVELVVQWANVTAFIVPNAYELARPCDVFSDVIRARPVPISCCAYLNTIR
jgi:hypothetical protein